MKTDMMERKECVEKERNLCVEWKDRGAVAMEVAQVCERVRASMKRMADRKGCSVEGYNDCVLAEHQGRQFRERQAAYALSLLGSLVLGQQGAVESEQHNPSALIVSPSDEMKNDVVKRVEVPQDVSREARSDRALFIGVELEAYQLEADEILQKFGAAASKEFLEDCRRSIGGELDKAEAERAGNILKRVEVPQDVSEVDALAREGFESPPVVSGDVGCLNPPVKPKPKPKPSKRMHLPENLRILEDLPGVLHAWRFRGRLFMMVDASYVKQVRKYFPDLDMRTCSPPSFGRQKMYSRWIEPIVEGKQMDCTLAREAKQLEKNFRAKLKQQLAWDSSLRDELEVEWSDIYGRFQCFDWDEQCKLIDEADKYPAHNYSSSPGYVGHRYRDDLGLDRDREPEIRIGSPFAQECLTEFNKRG